MWDETPFVDALFATLHPSVQADQEAARRHVWVVALGHGERRPLNADEAWKELKRKPAGFVYDRATELFFIPDFADHERCAGCLMLLRELRAPVDWNAAFQEGTLHNGMAADRYLSSGAGFVANSPSLTKGSGQWELAIGADVALTGQEKIWFREFRIRRA